MPQPPARPGRRCRPGWAPNRLTWPASRSSSRSSWRSAQETGSPDGGDRGEPSVHLQGRRPTTCAASRDGPGGEPTTPPRWHRTQGPARGLHFFEQRAANAWWSPSSAEGTPSQQLHDEPSSSLRTTPTPSPCRRCASNRWWTESGHAPDRTRRLRRRECHHTARPGASRRPGPRRSRDRIDGWLEPKPPAAYWPDPGPAAWQG